MGGIKPAIDKISLPQLCQYWVKDIFLTENLDK
jgi:hypothetical protein